MTYAQHIELFFRQLCARQWRNAEAARRARYHLACWELEELYLQCAAKKQQIEEEFSTDFSEAPTKEIRP